tara:strand:- start:2823 stop:4454 length:1632 start_codon:yes stop_codon:yes gene_type:complete
MASIFGFEITKKKKQGKSFTAPEASDDGAVNVATGNAVAQYLDMEGSIKNEIDLINRYRDMANQPECDAAVDDIVNEAIVISSEKENVLDLDLSDLGASDGIKDKIHDEFTSIMNILDFNKKGYEIFRKWFVDGRLYYHMIIDESKKKQGIQELRFIDPRKIRKVREVIKEKAPNGTDVVKGTVEYFVYNDSKLQATSQSLEGVKISLDSIAHVLSGLYNHGKATTISHLHKAIKPLNQLRMMEDAVVIYRISRAPERRIFYIDVGNLPKAKAEQYLRDNMNRYRNKLIYDADTGEIKDERKHMAMLEDFWLPRREGGRGTEISTLPGGQNLGEMEDVTFFQTKLYQALNVPPSRLQSDSGFSLGREAEITRDELKFSKFIQRLRNQFTSFFDQILKTQLVLKGIIKIEDWDKFRPMIQYKWAEDSYYRETKNSEILLGRLGLLREVSEYAGRYFSMDYIKREVLQMTDEEVREMEKAIAAEVKGEKLSPQTTMEFGIHGPQMEEPPPEEPQQPPEQPPEQPQQKEQLNGDFNDYFSDELEKI